MRRAIGLALILLFGPVPVISLLASMDVPDCRMACCKRKGLARSCALQHSSVSEFSVSFRGANNCPPGCSQVAGAPSLFAAGLLPPVSPFLLIPAETNWVLLAGWTAPSVIDSFLHQRPPPIVTA